MLINAFWWIIFVEKNLTKGVDHDKSFILVAAVRSTSQTLPPTHCCHLTSPPTEICSWIIAAIVIFSKPKSVNLFILLKLYGSPCMRKGLASEQASQDLVHLCCYITCIPPGLSPQLLRCTPGGVFWASQLVGHSALSLAQNTLPLPSSVPGCLVNSSVFKTQFTKLILRDVFVNSPKQSWSLPLWATTIFNTYSRVRPHTSWLWSWSGLNIRLSQLTHPVLYVNHWLFIYFFYWTLSPLKVGP